MERWVNKTAVVTGASVGIGAAVCVSMANAGLRVVGLAKRSELIDKLKAQVTGSGSITSRKCDVSKVDEIKDTFKWVEENFEGIDVLINNAGVLYFHKFISDSGDNQISDDEISAAIDINLKAVVLCAKYAIASMKKRGFDGHIINVNSIAGHYIPVRSGFNVYPCTKYAVGAFTETLLAELASFNNKIKVTSLSPGLVKTDMALQHGKIDAPALLPADIADTIVYILSTPPNVNIRELTIGSVAEKKV
ncbi:farnesol dehydrogenase-like [Battus philenor]|uniref:farnesol dehydrogenase-like n=1 Tax=Battus philenor TaxID=42288 RepID=UPI0035D0B094